MYSVEIYRDAAGQWRWRLVHRNGNTMADSGEGYASRGNCRRAVRRLAWAFFTAREVQHA